MTTRPNLFKGTIYGLAAFFFMAVMGILTKIASAKGGEIWVSFQIYAIGALIMIPLTLRDGVNSIKTDHLFKHIGRAVFGVTASFLYLLAMQKIPIVNATLLFNTSPLFHSYPGHLMHRHSRIQKNLVSHFIGVRRYRYYY